MTEPQRRILVVTEDESKLSSPLRMLRATPHSLTVLAPQAACDALETDSRFDLLVVDIEPPELAGFDVVRAWRRQKGGERPVLAVSAAFKREHIEGMLENAGVRRLFSLGIRPEEMLFWVNHALFPEAMRSRRSPRIPASFVLSIGGRKRALRGRAFNLSEEGLFLETSLAAAHGDVIELRFHLPQRLGRRDETVAHCEVVWANVKPRSGERGHPPYGLGLRFVDLDETVRGAIKSYVLSRLIEQTI